MTDGEAGNRRGRSGDNDGLWSDEQEKEEVHVGRGSRKWKKDRRREGRRVVDGLVGCWRGGG